MMLRFARFGIVHVYDIVSVLIIILRWGGNKNLICRVDFFMIILSVCVCVCMYDCKPNFGYAMSIDDRI